MNLPLQISFHHLDRSEFVENRIVKEAAKLDEFCDHIMSCRVVIDVPHRHHASGNVYQVRIDITVPGEEIGVVHEPAEHDPHYKNIDVAIRDAFGSAARKLEEYVRRQRNEVKHHGRTLHGRISKLFPKGGYGFIETPEKRELYFHTNSLLEDDFDRLAIGAEVTFSEEMGDKGPQASTVRLLGRRHHFA